MSYKIIAIPHFEKELKLLSKKYPSIKTDLSKLTGELLTNPHKGTPLGNHCYKIRMAIASKGKGKSSGARLITYLFVSDKIVYLLSIFDKSEKENISVKELFVLLKEIPN